MPRSRQRVRESLTVDRLKGNRRAMAPLPARSFVRKIAGASRGSAGIRLCGRFIESSVV